MATMIGAWTRKGCGTWPALRRRTARVAAVEMASWAACGDRHSAAIRLAARLTTAVSTSPSNSVASAHAVWSPEIMITGTSKCPQTAALSPISPTSAPLSHTPATRVPDHVWLRMACRAPVRA